jgi:hypothetical protein
MSPTLVLAALVVGAAVVWGAVQVVSELKATREDAFRARLLEIFTAFAPAAGAGSSASPITT